MVCVILKYVFSVRILKNVNRNSNLRIIKLRQGLIIVERYNVRIEIR